MLQVRFAFIMLTSVKCIARFELLKDLELEVVKL